jgi:hypothetical protein
MVSFIIIISPSIIRMFNLRKKRLSGHVTRMEKKRNACFGGEIRRKKTSRKT